PDNGLRGGSSMRHRVLTALVMLFGWVSPASSLPPASLSACSRVAHEHAQAIMRMSSKVVAVGAGEPIAPSSRAPRRKFVVFVYLAADAPEVEGLNHQILDPRVPGCEVEVAVTGPFHR